MTTTVRLRQGPAPSPSLYGPRWSTDRFAQYGWAVLPLRIFLGVTFIFAALQKLADPNFFDAGSATSIQAQTRGFVHTSPIGPLLSIVAPHAGLVGVAIALGEMSVGLALLIGLWTRLAAMGGALLALTFFLTVSWHTRPYYYGSDIVFLFAWTPFILAGAGGVLSADAVIAHRARVAAASSYAASSSDVDRRTVLLGARAAAALAAVVGVTAGLTTVTGHALASGSSPTPQAQPTPGRMPGRRSSAHRSRRTANRTKPSGPVIAQASQVPVGQGLRFTDPRTGRPAWLLHPSQGQFVAFSAVCTHAGCTVGLASSSEFACPCHGATYSTSSGAVLGGPAPSPLAQIPVAVSGQAVYLT